MCTGKLKTLLSEPLEGGSVNSFHLGNTVYFHFGPGIKSSEEGNNGRVAKINALLSTRKWWWRVTWDGLFSYHYILCVCLILFLFLARQWNTHVLCATVHLRQAAGNCCFATAFALLAQSNGSQWSINLILTTKRKQTLTLAFPSSWK